MKLFVVGMQESVHTARWLSQISDQGWQIYLFPVTRAQPHPNLRNVTIFGARPRRAASIDKSVRYIAWTSLAVYWDGLEARQKGQPSNRAKAMVLTYLLETLKPDIVHSLEFQHASYLTMLAKRKLGPKFPTWIATNWGSDIYLFGKLAEHQPLIREVLENCDYYSCECERDIQLAQELGLKAKVLPVLPNAGGIRLAEVLHFRQSGPISERKAIIVKGYQGWAGRALVAFQAFRLCLEALKGYTIYLYSSAEDTEIAARLFMYETGIPVVIQPPAPHEAILELFGKSRLYLGLSISDGISTSLLEAMVMGTFPIQSCTACANEWLTNGEGGFIVSPEDPHSIAEAIRRALTDDQLVNRAAEINSQVAQARLEYSKIKSQAISLYETVLQTQRS